ncbi:MAG: PfkB family carbohydrate kinase [Ignavibacteriaceae bacterium]
MILCVTINPLLERRFIFSEIKNGTENRDGLLKLKAGGKGINVSRQLNNLKVENLSFTFLGGTNGKILREILLEEKIKFTSIKTKSKTREAAIIIDETSNKISTFFSQNSKILKEEVEEFKARLERMIETSEIVIFSGSSPSEETDFIFPFGIETANNYDKISICDTYGKHLKNCLENSPTIVHNNINEAENSLNINLNDEKNKLQFLNDLYKKGIKQIYLTDGANNTFASNFDFNFKVENPSIKIKDSTGSGDAFVSGIAYSWHNNFTFEEGLMLASKLGIINTSKMETCNVTLQEVEELKLYPKIIPIGKKIKTIDAPIN